MTTISDLYYDEMAMVKRYNVHIFEPKFRQMLLAENISRTSVKNYLSDLRHFTGWAITNANKKFDALSDFDDIKTEDIINYRSYLQDAAIPVNTINRRLSSLRKVFSYLEKDLHAGENPLTEVKNIPFIKPLSNIVNINNIESREAIENREVAITKEFNLMGKINKIKEIQIQPSFIYEYIWYIIIVVFGFFLFLNTGKYLVTHNRISLASLSTKESKGTVIAFSGKLTDEMGIPIETKSDLTFRLYENEKTTTPLYQGSCTGSQAVEPDIYGAVEVTIGSDCGMKPIPEDLLSSHRELFLGVTVGSDAEMSPRQQIATVGYAGTADKLQGLPLGYNSNNIPFIDSNGDILIGNETSGIHSTFSSSNFLISSANTLTLQTADEGDIVLEATGSGSLKLRVGGSTDQYTQLLINPEGNVGIGSLDPNNFKLQVSGDVGPNTTNFYNLGSESNQWAKVYAQEIIQNGNAVCDAGGNNCPGSNAAWTLSLPYLYTTDSSHKVGIGTTETSEMISQLYVTKGKDNGASENALVVFNQTGGEDIFTASSSGTTRFVLSASGNVGINAPSPSEALELGGDNTNIRFSSLNGTRKILTGGASNLSLMPGGNVGIGTDSPSQKLDVNGTVKASDFNCADCINQNDISSSSIGQGELKTAVSTVSVSADCNSNTALIVNTIPASGEYGFWPTFRRSGSCTSGTSHASIIGAGNEIISSSPTTYITIQITPDNTGGGPITGEASQRYLQASPPYYLDGYYISHFIYVLWNKKNGDIMSVWEAEDPVWENNGRDAEKIPHPFIDFYNKNIPVNYEISMLDPSQVQDWKQKASARKIGLATYINMFMKINGNDISSPESPKTHKSIHIPGHLSWAIAETKSEEEINRAQVQSKMEKVEVNDTHLLLSAGDIVEAVLAHATDEEKDHLIKQNDLLLQKSRQTNSQKMIGVISENTADFINTPGSDGKLPLALTGIVSVKVSTLGGAIKAGDPLTTSTIPGVAMKSSLSGMIIGRALEDFEPGKKSEALWQCKDEKTTSEYISCGLVMAYITPTWFDPNVALNNDGSIIFYNTLHRASKTKYEGLIENTSDQLFSTFSSKVMDVIKIMDVNVLLAENKIISPIIEGEIITATKSVSAPEIKTNKITTDNDVLEIDLNKNSSEFANERDGKLTELLIKGFEGKTVASVDSKGSATFSGILIAEELSVQNASISGTLIAEEIRSNTINTLEEKISSTSSTLANNYQHLSGSVNEIQKLIGELKDKPLPSPAFYPDAEVIPENTGLEGIYEEISVTGNSNLFNVAVTGSFTNGGLLIEKNTILSLSSELRLTALDTISFFDDSVTIAKDGTLTTKGTLIAQAGIETDQIRPLKNNSEVKVTLPERSADQTDDKRSKLVIANALGVEVSSIDSSGSARFSELILNKYMEATASSVIIPAEENLSRNGVLSAAIETKEEVAGIGIVPENTPEVIIYNDKVTEGSLIYLTPVDQITGTQLTMVQKETCTTAVSLCRPYFKVATNINDHAELRFNWLIIN